MRREGWDIDILANVRRGGLLLGLCGGYQMLGRTISDPQGLEGRQVRWPGWGLLDVETTLLPDKTLTRVSGTHAPSGAEITGYEIHLGTTHGADTAPAICDDRGKPEGAITRSGQVMGTYLHGCFGSDAFRSAFLASLGAESSRLRFDERIETTLDDLARHIESHIDVDRLLALAEPVL